MLSALSSALFPKRRKTDEWARLESTSSILMERTAHSWGLASRPSLMQGRLAIIAAELAGWPPSWPIDGLPSPAAVCLKTDSKTSRLLSYSSPRAIRVRHRCDKLR